VSETSETTRRRIESFQEDFGRIESALRATIVGQESLIRELLTAVFAGGHVLLEGLPGLGKTHLAKALANGIGLSLARVQCTPDLMPADIVGSEILASPAASGERELRFRPGPIFSPILLVDEINRATPRTQSALLEAMQERQVTYAGRDHPLPAPFWVLATQNPIELEGTYPLPEAQLDRFFFKCDVAYPSGKALLEIVDVSLDEEPADRLQPLLSGDRVQEMMRQAREVVVADVVKRDAVELVLATQPEHPESSPLARRHLRYGASPRALQTVLRASRIRALVDGRGHVAPEDLRAVALPALRHRVLLSIESEVEGTEVDGILEGIVEEWTRAR
jgi:MoxR-like ATPase